MDETILITVALIIGFIGGALARQSKLRQLAEESQFEKALAILTNFGAAEYRRGYADALRIAEQIEIWLNPAPGSDVTIAEVRVWASSLIAKAKKEMAGDEQD